MMNEVQKEAEELMETLIKEVNKVNDIQSINRSSPVVGKKFDQGKSALDLIPYEALEEIGKVLEFGKQKYGEANWANGIAYSRLIAAALRHLNQFNSGENFDKETGISHVAHAGCNIMFLLWMIKNREDMDNRWINKIEKKAPR